MVDCKNKKFDFCVSGCARRHLTAELPTQRLVVRAAVSPDTVEHGGG